jgi:hypothetical protein
LHRKYNPENKKRGLFFFSSFGPFLLSAQFSEAFYRTLIFALGLILLCRPQPTKPNPSP